MKVLPGNIKRNFIPGNMFNQSIVGSIIYRIYEYLMDQNILSGHMSNSLFLYENRLQDLIDWANYAGHHVYLSELVGNFHAHAPPHYFVPSLSQLKQLFKCTSIYDSRKKINCLERFIDLNKTNSPHLRFLIAREKYLLRPNNANYERLNKFYQYDYSKRPIPEKNEIIRKIAHENENISFVPLVEAFKKEGGELLGYNLFEDAHHPNIQGMMIIANQFLRLLKRDRNVKILPINQIKEKYRLSERHEKIIYSRIQWFLLVYGLKPFPFQQLLRLNDLIEIYYDYNPTWSTIMKYLLYPMLPVNPKIESLRKARQHLEINKVNALKKTLFPYLLENKFYPSILKNAKRINYISEDLYQEYLNFISSRD